MRVPHKPHLRLWVEALRHGGFRQAQGVLRDPSGAMCCLGVAQVVAMNHGRPDPEYWGNNAMDTSIAGEFYGIGSNPVLKEEDGDYLYSAAEYNDKLQRTFAQIADAIERTYSLNEDDDGPTSG